MESLQHFKKPWAHEHEPATSFLDAVKATKPTVLIGTSGVGRTFRKEVVQAMAALNEKPLIMALSNPTSQAECTAEEAYTWTEGLATFASGRPFDPVEYNDKIFIPGIYYGEVEEKRIINSIPDYDTRSKGSKLLGMDKDGPRRRYDGYLCGLVFIFDMLGSCIDI